MNVVKNKKRPIATSKFAKSNKSIIATKTKISLQIYYIQYINTRVSNIYNYRSYCYRGISTQKK